MELNHEGGKERGRLWPGKQHGKGEEGQSVPGNLPEVCTARCEGPGKWAGGVMMLEWAGQGHEALRMSPRAVWPWRMWGAIEASEEGKTTSVVQELPRRRHRRGPGPRLGCRTSRGTGAVTGAGVSRTHDGAVVPSPTQGVLH